MAYFIDERTIEEIKDRADIVSVVSNYMDLKKVGSNYKGLCPFHGEKTPSFTVSPQKKIYKCFGCGEGGNVINFVMKMEGLSFPEACKQLGDEFGIEIESRGNFNEEYQNSLDEMYQINRAVALYYMKNLASSDYPRKYLIDRNISQNSIKKFGIGYGKNSWDDLVNYLKKSNYDLDIALKARVIGKNSRGNYYDYFRNRIIFPIIDNRSRVLGFGARALGDDSPKYLNTSDSPIFNKGKNLYGLNYLNKNEKNEKVILVEGYIDVIALDSNGINGAVASLGTAFTQDQGKILKKYTDNIYISYDGDLAGRSATKKALDVLHSLDIDGNVISLPDEMDPDNFVNKYGKFKYEVEIKNSKSGYNFIIEEYKKGLNLNKIEDLVKLIRYMGNIIKKIKSPIERELQMKKLSNDFGISLDSLKSEIFGNTVTINNSNLPKNNHEDNKPLSSRDKAIIEIFKLAMLDRDNFNFIDNNLDFDIIENNQLKEVYFSLKSSYSEEENIDRKFLLDYLLSNNIISKKLYEELSLDLFDIDNINNKDLIKDLINRLEYTENKLTRSQIVKKIKILDSKKEKSDEEIQELKELLEELMNVNS